MRANEQEPDKRRERWTSGREIAKSISIKSVRRRSGGCARKAVQLTPGDLCCVLETGLRESRGSLTAAQKSADGIVVRRERMKAETVPHEAG